jgi:hypothetical protein
MVVTSVIVYNATVQAELLEGDAVRLKSTDQAGAEQSRESGVDIDNHMHLQLADSDIGDSTRGDRF